MERDVPLSFVSRCPPFNTCDERHLNGIIGHMTKLNDVMRKARAERLLPSPDERRAIREAAGVSQAAIGLILGVRPSTVTRYETGSRSPRGEMAVAYLRVLDRLRREES